MDVPNAETRTHPDELTGADVFDDQSGPLARLGAYADTSGHHIAADLAALLTRAAQIGIAVCPDVDREGVSYSIEWHAGEPRSLDVDWSTADGRWIVTGDAPVHQGADMPPYWSKGSIR